VILPDVNLLVHAYNRDSPVHRRAKAWLENLLGGTEPVGLAWLTVLGFIRITTNRQILSHPFPVRTACDHVRSWMVQPYVTLVHPSDRHAEILFRLLGRKASSSADRRSTASWPSGRPGGTAIFSLPDIEPSRAADQFASVLVRDHLVLAEPGRQVRGLADENTVRPTGVGKGLDRLGDGTSRR
jgi:toxin-antitoxin system PIN domain toxin